MKEAGLQSEDLYIRAGHEHEVNFCNGHKHYASYEQMYTLGTILVVCVLFDLDATCTL